MEGMKQAILLILGLCIAGYLWYLHALSPRGGTGAVKLTVEKGMGVSQVGGLLAEKEIIRSPLAFKLYMKFSGAEGGVQAGTFLFRPSMSVEDIAQVLRTGKAEEVSVTIPEGWTVRQIDAYLAERGLAASGAVLECLRTCDFGSFDFLPAASRELAPRGGRLEGYLFPETYFVNEAEFFPKFFLERMLGTFRARVVENLGSDIAESDRSLHEIVTMASLVEAETKTDEERPVVAGILWKRLKAGMPLGVDATVRYILDKPTAAITESDLQIDSPYNTRKVRGLPPGPIENPGMSAILAALKPQESPYWFYLHDSSGTIRYAVTNEEHNENRRRYLR